MTWWVHFLAALGFSLAGSILPGIVPLEAYAIGAGVLAPSMALAVLAGLTVGQTLGKMALFVAIRRGKELPIFRRRQRTPDPDTLGGRMRIWSTQLMASMAHPGRQAPVLLLAAVTGIPPLYVAAIYAPTTKMSLSLFTAVIFIGSAIRFAVMIFTGDAVAGLLQH